MSGRECRDMSNNVRFIVWFGSGEGAKVFERREDARTYAAAEAAGSEQAEIYRVELSPDMAPAKMTRAALAALRMGEGHFVEAISSRLLADRREREQSFWRRFGPDIRREAAQRVLAALACEQSRTKGKIVAVPSPKRMRKGPRRDAVEAELNALIERLLASPKYAHRVEQAIDTILFESGLTIQMPDM